MKFNNDDFSLQLQVRSLFYKTKTERASPLYGIAKVHGSLKVLEKLQLKLHKHQRYRSQVNETIWRQRNQFCDRRWRADQPQSRSLYLDEYRVTHFYFVFWRQRYALSLCSLAWTLFKYDRHAVRGSERDFSQKHRISSINEMFSSSPAAAASADDVVWTSNRNSK